MTMTDHTGVYATVSFPVKGFSRDKVEITLPADSPEDAASKYKSFYEAFIAALGNGTPPKPPAAAKKAKPPKVAEDNPAGVAKLEPKQEQEAAVAEKPVASEAAAGTLDIPDAETLIANAKTLDSDEKKDVARRCMWALEDLAMLVDQFKGQPPAKLVETLNFKKPLGGMTYNDMGAVLELAENLLAQVRNGSDKAVEADAYVKVMTMIRRAESLEQMEAEKAVLVSQGLFKILSAHSELFIAIREAGAAKVESLKKLMPAPPSPITAALDAA